MASHLSNVSTEVTTRARPQAVDEALIQETEVEQPRKPNPCSRCGAPLVGAWVCTNRGRLLCGNEGCQRWARAQGETIFTTSEKWNRGAAPLPPKRRQTPRCASCGDLLPARKARFGRQKQFCSLTCLQAGETR
jgi:formylmethanofuran dehydrogenase subunit E